MVDENLKMYFGQVLLFNFKNLDPQNAIFFQVSDLLAKGAGVLQLMLHRALPRKIGIRHLKKIQERAFCLRKSYEN